MGVSPQEKLEQRILPFGDGHLVWRKMCCRVRRSISMLQLSRAIQQ